MDDWRELNQANWDERVTIHLGGSGYDLGPLRTGESDAGGGKLGFERCLVIESEVLRRLRVP